MIEQSSVKSGGGGIIGCIFCLQVGRPTTGGLQVGGGGLKTITIFVLIFFVDPFWKFKGNFKIWAGCF